MLAMARVHRYIHWMGTMLNFYCLLELGWNYCRISYFANSCAIIHDPPSLIVLTGQANRAFMWPSHVSCAWTCGFSFSPSLTVVFHRVIPEREVSLGSSLLTMGFPLLSSVLCFPSFMHGSAPQCLLQVGRQLGVSKVIEHAINTWPHITYISFSPLCNRHCCFLLRGGSSAQCPKAHWVSVCRSFPYS